MEFDQFKRALTKGLLSGYVGGHEIEKGKRSVFPIKISHPPTSPEGDIYHDEWVADRVGGGQELVELKDGRRFTRLYAGGTFKGEDLAKLGIDEEDVIGFLKQSIITLKDQTRLFESAELMGKSEWFYSYEIVNEFKRLPLTVGKETIAYKGNLVFVHMFLLSPIIK